MQNNNIENLNDYKNAKEEHIRTSMERIAVIDNSITKWRNKLDSVYDKIEQLLNRKKTLETTKLQVMNYIYDLNKEKKEIIKNVGVRNVEKYKEQNKSKGACKKL